jgi:low temperature requirement protein LtrA
VLFAFAVKTTIAHVHAELSIVPALALCGGPALYLLAYAGLRFRVARTVRGGRLAAALVCFALVPVALAVQAIVALALVAAVWVVLHAYELIWWRSARAELRAEHAPASVS